MPSSRAVDDEAVRVIILAGAGKHFSAGHDLGSPQEMADQKKTPLEPGFKGEYRRLWERFFENTMRWRDLPKPTIAQVQGYCIMGGMMIASACDLIIASDDAPVRRPRREVGRQPRAVFLDAVGLRAAQDQGISLHRRASSAPPRPSAPAW